MRIITKKEKRERRVAEKYAAKKLAAFDLFVTLDKNLSKVYKLKDVALKVGVELSTVMFWKKEGQWQEKLESAINKAKARASSSKEMQSLLTQYLYGEKIKKEIGEDPVKVISKYELLKKKRLEKAIKYVSDIIYEIRKYNHNMFKMLVAVPNLEDLNYTEVVKNRDIIHRAWLDTTNKLFEIFGVSTIKQLAIEVLADNMLAQQLANEEIGEKAQAGVNITINQSKTESVDILDRSKNIILDDGASELIMKCMVGGGKIDGPVEYTGPKEKSLVGEIEDAVFTDKGRTNKASEE